MIHILTPFNRPENYRKLRDMLPDDVGWHLISTIPPPGWDPTYWKLNWWIEHYALAARDSDWCAFFCDDDGYPAGFWTRFLGLADPEADVAVVSMDRGQRKPRKGAHPAVFLEAAPQNMRQTCVGLEQFIVRGRVLRTMRFENHMWADGRMAEWLAARYNVQYIPELIVLFNRLEPGRFSWFGSVCNWVRRVRAGITRWIHRAR